MRLVIIWLQITRFIRSEIIDYKEFMGKYDKMLDWLADVYVNALNTIHYMHDKYYYESAQLAASIYAHNITIYKVAPGYTYYYE